MSRAHHAAARWADAAYRSRHKDGNGWTFAGIPHIAPAVDDRNDFGFVHVHGDFVIDPFPEFFGIRH